MSHIVRCNVSSLLRRIQSNDKCSITTLTCGSIGEHSGIVARYEALDETLGGGTVHLLLHTVTAFWLLNSATYLKLFWGGGVGWADLTGRIIKGNIKYVSLFPGAVGPQDIIGILHGVHQDHHLVSGNKRNKNMLLISSGGSNLAAIGQNLKEKS